MSIFVVICFALAAVLGFLAAFSVLASPRYNLLAAAVGFLALGFFLQSLAGVTG